MVDSIWTLQGCKLTGREYNECNERILVNVGMSLIFLTSSNKTNKDDVSFKKSLACVYIKYDSCMVMIVLFNVHIDGFHRCALYL